MADESTRLTEGAAPKAGVKFSLRSKLLVKKKGQHPPPTTRTSNLRAEREFDSAECTVKNQLKRVEKSKAGYFGVLVFLSFAGLLGFLFMAQKQSSVVSHMVRDSRLVASV